MIWISKYCQGKTGAAVLNCQETSTPFFEPLSLFTSKKSTNKAKNSLTGKSGNALCDWVVYEHRQIFSKYKTNHISPPGRAVYLYNIFTDLKSNIQIQSQLTN